MSEEVEQHAVWHYDYHPRKLPCLADQANCDYLDALWEANDLGMVYSGILWLAIGGIVLILAIGRRSWVSRRRRPLSMTTMRRNLTTETEADDGQGVSLIDGKPRQTRTLGSRSLRAFMADVRRHLLPDSIQFVFGRTTRLQVLVLAILLAYLTIFSFVGMEYALWPPPVVTSPGVVKYQNTAGIWSNRIGILAYALTPFSILLASRESILSVLTGIPYQSFNFLHRWIGHIILVQSLFHALAWTIICLGLYGPQPKYGVDWITQEYMIWGLCAQFVLILLWVFSTSWVIRLTGFEFFRKAHYVLAMVYIGICWAHWEFLGDWVLCGLLLWFFDRIARLVRTFLLHHQCIYGEWGFHAANAQIQVFSEADGSVDVGETRKIAQLAAQKLAAQTNNTTSTALTAPTTPVILQGPYGEKSTRDLDSQVNVLAIAGGTGITYVLPVLLGIVHQHKTQAVVCDSTRNIELVWMIRYESDLTWIRPELDIILEAAAACNIRVSIKCTRATHALTSDKAILPLAAPKEKTTTGDNIGPSTDTSSPPSPPSPTSPTTSALQIEHLVPEATDETNHRHPDTGGFVHDFVAQTIRGPTVVYASGPWSMISDLRSAIAPLNSGKKVWAGDERYDIELREDNRLEW